MKKAKIKLPQGAYRDGCRILQPLAQTRSDGVCANLIGYRKRGVDYFY